MSFGFDFIDDLVARSRDAMDFSEVTSANGGPHRTLTRADDSDRGAGFVRVWAAQNSPLLDRMIHVRLLADPVDTQLLFLFGRSETAMPHFHAQIVQFAPDACVFNADFLPRLDPVDHPDYYTRIFRPITKAYRRAINDYDNICSRAPANPTIATYLSPWGIGAGQPTNRAELDRVAPQIHAYLEHYLRLDHELDYAISNPDDLLARDKRHLDCFFSDRLDPRAWNGVYGLVGDAAGQEIKTILRTGLA